MGRSERERENHGEPIHPFERVLQREAWREQLDTAPNIEANGELDGLETEARVNDGGPQRGFRSSG